MDTVYRMAKSVMRMFESRLVSASALAVVSAIIVVFVSFNVNAVTVVDGDTSRVVLTLKDDPEAVVQDAGVQLREGDRVVAAKNLSVVSVDRAADVQVTVDGISTIVRLADGTVADALEKVGVSLGEDDKMNVSLDQTVSDGLDITIDRIAYQEYTVTETTKYTSSTYYTNTLAKGRTLVKRAGKNGIKTVTYRKTIVNGEVTKTDVLKQTVQQKLVNEMKLVGMDKGTPLSKAPYEILLDKNGQPVNYSKMYRGKATAYSSDRGYAGTGTASGRKAAVGVVAVDPRKIPYGTELYITSADGSYVYGYAIAGDTGGALRSGKVLVDLFFDHYEECLKFGAKTLNVYVLE